MTTRQCVIMLGMLFVLLTSAFMTPAMSQQHPFGGTLVIEQAEEITHLLQQIEPGGAWYADFSIFDRLVEVNARTAEVIPGLAESWQVSNDGLTYTFYLYKNVLWHDGVKFTSADVKYTYDYMIQNDLAGKALLAPTKSITTPDDYTVIISLETPNAAFLTQLGSYTGYLGIVPQHIYDNGTPWADNPNIYKPIGTGPFKFDELRSGEFVRLVRNDNYFKGKPYLDALVWRIVPDVSVALQLVKSNEIQVVGAGNSPPYSELSALSKLPGVTVRSSPLGGEDVFSLEFNTGNPNLPFKDVKVRTAIAHALDPQEIEDKAFFGYTKVAPSLFTKDIPWAFNPNAKIPQYNLAEAERLLDEAGYPRGSDGIRFKTNIEFGNYYGGLNQAIAEIVVQQLAKVGIEAKFSMYEWLFWYQKIKVQHDFEMSIYIDYSSPDPDQVYRLVGTGQESNGGQYSNPRIDELFALGRKATDQAERAKYYFEIQDILAKELPFVPLVDQDYYFAINAAYHDLWFDPGVKATKLNPWMAWKEAAQPTVTTTVPATSTEMTTSAETTPPQPMIGTDILVALAAVAVIVIAALVVVMRRRKKT